MNHSLFETTTNDFALKLIDKDRIFRRIFVGNSEWLYLDADQKTKAQEIFNEEKINELPFADMSLDEFVQTWKREHANYPIENSGVQNVNGEDADCMALNSNTKQSIFEARTGNYKSNIPVVRPPFGRGRPTEFNAYKFIMESESKQTGVPLDLKFESEEDLFEDLEMNDECDTFQETLNVNEYADNNLRYIANIVAILNSKKNGYPVLELCGESHLHIT